MRGLARAFTLTELLVVLAIISILALIVFPVASTAKASANRAVCISNMRQITAAINLYIDDYDGLMMLTSQQPAPDATSRTDRTWVQLVLPYTRSFAVFRCPGDYSHRPKPEASFDQDLVPGDTDSRYYSASMRTNYALNYQYLSPIFERDGRWVPQPKPLAYIQQPSETVLLIDSVWNRLPDGTPDGGGSWLVTPPCRYYELRGGLKQDSFSDYTFSKVDVFTTSIGWDVANNVAPNVYGNAWPWHNGRMNMANVDGSVRSIVPSQLAAGCNLRDNWQGSIYDTSAYIWDGR